MRWPEVKKNSQRPERTIVFVDETGLSERDLREGAQAAGFPTDLWTCPRVAPFIWARCGVHYEVSRVWRLLRSLGWTPQKPERRAVERNEREIQRWIKKQQPRIQKSPPAISSEQSAANPQKACYTEQLLRRGPASSDLYLPGLERDVIEKGVEINGGRSARVSLSCILLWVLTASAA